MKIITKTISQLTSEEYTYCYRANLSSTGARGEMRPKLVEYRAHPAWAKEDGAEVVLLWDGKREGAHRLLGWAMVFDNYSEHKDAYFWVKKPLRDRGYGTILMKEVKKIEKQPKVYPWNEKAIGFFSKFVVDAPEHRLVSKPKVC